MIHLGIVPFAKRPLCLGLNRRARADKEKEIRTSTVTGLGRELPVRERLTAQPVTLLNTPSRVSNQILNFIKFHAISPILQPFPTLCPGRRAWPPDRGAVFGPLWTHGPRSVRAPCSEGLHAWVRAQLLPSSTSWSHLRTRACR